MIDSGQTQQRALRAIGEVAKQPDYFSQFADSFYGEYVESRQDFLNREFAHRTGFGASYLIHVLFSHLRAAMYVYRQLNFKRLLNLRFDITGVPPNSQLIEMQFSPAFREAIKIRYSKFLTSEHEAVPPSELSSFFIPAFVQSTNTVLTNVAEHLYIDRPKVHRLRLSRIEDAQTDVLALANEARLKARRIQILYESNGTVDTQTILAFGRYEQALELIFEPAGLYDMQGVEKFHLAGVELELLQRLHALVFSSQIAAASEMTPAVQEWHSAHNALLSMGLRKYQESVTQPILPLTDLDPAVSWRLERAATKRPITDRAGRQIPKLGDNLPAGVTIAPSVRDQPAPRIGRPDGMAKRYPKALINIFASGTLLFATGLVVTGFGVVLHEFNFTYLGVGLISVGLSAVTTTLLQVTDVDPSSQ